MVRKYLGLLGVSNQLISLASREGNITASQAIFRVVSNQLISLASREKGVQGQEQYL